MEFACWQLGNCPSFTTNPFNTLLMPFDAIFGGLSLVIFWSLIIGILWFRTQNPPLVGIIGVAMVGAYLTNMQTMTFPTGEMETARMVGSTLLALSIGISIYQLVVSRILAHPQ